MEKINLGTGSRFRKHNERCQNCKDNVYALLVKIYGTVEKSPKIAIGTKPEYFAKLSSYSPLNDIFNLLEKERGLSGFVKAKTLPRCDFFVTTPGFILEFDESQHFTALRKVALLHYPPDLKLGFSKQDWITLCDHIRAKDNDPIYRDEQRAWYDTIRDFLVIIRGLKPTVRLYSQEMQWCSLNPAKIDDVNKFHTLLTNKFRG